MLLKKLLYAFVNYAFFAACCAIALAIQTYIFCKLPINFFLLSFVFFATICSYNLHFFLAKYSSTGLIIRLTTLHVNAHVYCIFFGVVGMCATFLPSNLPIIPVLFSLVCTSLYSLPFLQIKSLEKIKKAGFLKTILLAFTWAYVTVYLPVAASNINQPIIIYWLVQRLLFMLVLCIIFDTRDVESDMLKGFHTLATDLSSKAIQILVILLFVASVVQHFYGIYFYASAKQVLGLQAVVACTVIIYVVSLKKRGYLFYYCIVDGLMIVSAIVSTLVSI